MDDSDHWWDSWAWATWWDIVIFWVVVIALAMLTAWTVSRRRARHQAHWQDEPPDRYP